MVVKVAIFLMNVIYSLFKLFPIKNKIVFISRQSDKPSLDFRMLKSEINKINPNIEIVFLTKKMKKNIKEVFKSVKIIFLQMYHLATSKICVTDGYNIPISVLKHKKTLKVVQIWHSLAAIKKFGYQSLQTEKQKTFANLMKMHKNYDYIISGSDAMTPYFMKAFNYPKNKFISLGLPRIDYLLERSKINKKNILAKYPKFRNKKIILYVPTFRDNNNYKINELINEIDLNKYIIIVKKHPLMNYEVKETKNVYACDDFTSLQLLSIANYVITDYSAISVEASVLNKPLFIYAYDLEEYSKYPGINMDLKKDFKQCLFTDAKSLYKSLAKEKYDTKIVDNFQKKYVCNMNGTVTTELAKFIVERSVFDEKTNN